MHGGQRSLLAAGRNSARAEAFLQCNLTMHFGGNGISHMGTTSLREYEVLLSCVAHFSLYLTSLFFVAPS